MNTTLKEKIAVMKAAAAGKPIECQPVDNRSEWNPAPVPSWNWNKFDYRVRIEPKVIYVTRYSNGGLSSFNNEHEERANADICRRHMPGIVITSEKYIQDTKYTPKPQ